MNEGFSFCLGPLSIRLEGEHQVVRWARVAFAPVACDEQEMSLVIRFTDSAVHPCSPTAVGDDRASVGKDTVSFRSNPYEMRISAMGGGDARYLVEFHLRDRRSLWRRTCGDLEEAYKMWLSHGASPDMHLLKTFAYSYSPLPILAALLHRGAGLIHASGFSVGGEGVLLPAWGGGGKSTVCTRAVLQGRADFLSDDHSIVDSAGNMHLHMMPIHTYAYHLDQDAALRERVLGSCTVSNRFAWSLAMKIRRHRAVRWVSPATVFGSDRLAQRAPIHEVILLYRADVPDFVWESCSPAEAAAPCVGVMLSEVSDLTDRLARAEAGWEPGFLPSLGETHSRLKTVYEQAFSHGSCARLLIPRACDGDRLVAFLRTKSERIDRAMATSRPADGA